MAGTRVQVGSNKTRQDKKVRRGMYICAKGEATPALEAREQHDRRGLTSIYTYLHVGGATLGTETSNIQQQAVRRKTRTTVTERPNSSGRKQQAWRLLWAGLEFTRFGLRTLPGLGVSNR